MMKKMTLFVALILQATAAMAGTVAQIPLGTLPAEDTVIAKGYSFRLNAKTQKAFVRVNVDSPVLYGTETIYGGPYEKDFAVEGLSYDAAANQIVFVRDGVSAVCATAKKGLFRTTFANTGRCSVASKPVATVTEGWSGSADHQVWSRITHRSNEVLFSVSN